MMKDFAMENGILTGCNPDIVKADIPDNVKFIDESAFWYCDNLTIHCSQGSYAKEYAKANNIPCELNDTPKHKAHDMEM